MNEWIKAGCLPDDPDLAAALASVEYAYDGNDAIQLERQYDVKRRGLPSPDDAEALALTFAYPVAQHSEAEERHTEERGPKRKVV
jgi:phage terminase large subunit